MRPDATLTVDQPTDTTIVVTRRFQAPPPVVFEAFTTPALLRRWMIGPDGWAMTVCDVDLRVGGRFRYVWARAGVPDMGMGGTFVEIDRPHRIVHRELFDADWTGGETTVTTEFAAEGGGTVMRMTVLYASREARDGALATGMTAGMAMGYARLDEILAA
jgi:uncharacterized protein YndB with AHSA1/START domain